MAQTKTSQLIFFEKNKGDPDFSGVQYIASENNEIASFAFNRKNTSAWQTDDSLDADNTTFIVDFGRTTAIDSILLIGHNFKDFQIEHFDGAVFNDFTLVAGGLLDITGNTADNNYFSVVSVPLVEKIRITIKATFVADKPKILTQFIPTELIVQFEGWPVLNKVKVGRITQEIPMLDGLSAVIDRQGAAKYDLNVAQYLIQDDLDKIQNMIKRTEGFLFWPSGGDETAFSPLVEGYRFEDIFLSRFMGQFQPNLRKGIYPGGIVYKGKLRQTNR